jgi:hypothetical protein
MNRTTYKRATNFCFVVAAASVILFDRFPHLHWLTGSLLIASGVAAVAIHFYVQWRPAETSNGLLVPVEAIEPVRAEGPSLLAGATEVDTGVDPRMVFVKFAMDYPYRPPIDTDAVAVLCQKLASTDTDFEVTITGEGNLTIRPIREKQQRVFFANFERRSTKGTVGLSELIQ